MSYIEYWRGVQDERFANQVALGRLAQSRDEWARHARQQEAVVAGLREELMSLNAKLTSAEKAFVKAQASSSECIRQLEGNLASSSEHIRQLAGELAHLKEEYDWLTSVAVDQGGLRT